MQNLTLATLWKLFLLRLKWLILGLVCGGLLMGAYTVFRVEDRYVASVSLYVQNAQVQSGVANTNNLAASRMLTNSYAVILRDKETMRMVADRMTMSAGADTVAGALSVDTSEDSAIITVSANTTDALLSQNICQAVCNVAPELLYDTIGAGTITPLSEVPPAVQIRPNFVRNIALGAVGGFAAVALVVLIMHITDMTIKSKEDLCRVAAGPVLGEIPSLNS